MYTIGSGARNGNGKRLFIYLFIYFINLWVPEIREVNESNIYIYILTSRVVDLISQKPQKGSL
jgi:hypothetical protein